MYTSQKDENQIKNFQIMNNLLTTKFYENQFLNS